MSRFLISRTAAGVRFLLESDSGRVLITSKDYATLDACKKGICSLVYYAPIVPVVDATGGAPAPNPKLEIRQEARGLSFVLKSANGKSVVESPAFATRKACLRAISMLRTGVQGAEVLFSRPAGFTPLTVGGMVRDPAPTEPTAAFADPQPPVSQPLVAPLPRAEVTAPARPDKVISPAPKVQSGAVRPSAVAPKSAPVKPSAQMRSASAEKRPFRVSVRKKKPQSAVKKASDILTRLFKR